MNKSFQFSLGPHFEQFIEKKIKSRRYASESEVVRSALRLWEENDKKLILLKQALEEGEASGFAKTGILRHI